MKIIGFGMVASLSLLLAACVSDQEIDQDKCSSFGFRPGTDAFSNCMMNQNTQRADDERRFLDRMQADEQRDRDRKNAQRDRDIDTRPQFDKDGNPNFDTEGNYQGCHGVGCLVDNPDT
ncbi:hypothetical protein [Limoniibacter endophyticus]|uniref:Lipoprotein n=1 Tax=Limoniibacter endophyticus TaxID=1565040 RepID=A0A8J3GHG5_9HYPH|nr:hypothetical protein [Limoniibacter endophyticus]GHC79030.1 hypothetical protein GCM10010136_31230 [Limoniibacter endophyticus]